MSRIRYVARLDDANLAPSYFDAEHLVTFTSQADARAFLVALTGWQATAYAYGLDGAEQRHDGYGLDAPTLTLYAVPADVPDAAGGRTLADAVETWWDPYPDALLSVGPRGGIRVERAL